MDCSRRCLKWSFLMDAIDHIKRLLEAHPVMLFMRGSPDRPMCEGSAIAVASLRAAGATFKSIDVQDNPEIRAYLPKHSDQKGFPQLFLFGELIGGSDIIRELCEQGELQDMVRPVTALAS
jgi:monothiol glutaredoxin